MSDCDMEDSAPAEDCSCAPDTSMDCSSSVEPQPDNETCVSDTTDTTEHSHHCGPISEDEPAGASSLEEIHDNALVTDDLYDTVLSDPCLDVTPELEHGHRRHVPSFRQYITRPSYKPSYMMNRSRNPRQTVYKDCVLAMDGPRKTEARVSAAETNELIYRCVAVFMGVLICLVVFSAIGRINKS